jgi:signal transduction histidine kinase
MPHRMQRTPSPSPRVQLVDRLMLPAVTLLLILGAAFVVAAWTQAGDVVQHARRADEHRAQRLAGAVSRVIERRWTELSAWSDANGALLERGREGELQATVDKNVMAGSTVQLGWIVVRPDGTVAAVAEAREGPLSASGITDDLRTLGRQSAARGEPLASGRLKVGDQAVFATAWPVGASGHASKLGTVINVSNLPRSSFGAFIDQTGSAEQDEVALLDSRDRLLLGNPNLDQRDSLREPVGRTGWSIAYRHGVISSFLPGWAYPGFALLLVAFALAYALQDLNGRRQRRRGDARSRQVHALYDLAERVLHAHSIEEQAQDLARSAMQLASVDAATVYVSSVDGLVEHSAGTASPGQTKYRVPIIGPRDPVGELVVSRSGEQLDDEEQWVVQTAATLVGAAMHTLVSLETERAAAAELQRLDELRSNLLATVAHELLSPLTAVKGVLGLMSMQDDLGERGREYVGVATERTDRLVALIRDLFDCSLLETGQLDIRPRRQRADELLESALGAQEAARGGELRLSATPNLMITVDPVRFDQLVNNLVTNAFRHGAAPVEVAVRPGEGGTLVIVSDEGPGIPIADRAEIFGKFWQGSSGHARTSQGAGLGLSLVQGLVRVHGGDIHVDSTHADGRGARFTAFFPDTTPEQPTPSPTPFDEAEPTLA